METNCKDQKAQGPNDNDANPNQENSGYQYDQSSWTEQFKEWNQTRLRDSDEYSHPDFIIDGC